MCIDDKARSEVKPMDTQTQLNNTLRNLVELQGAEETQQRYRICIEARMSETRDAMQRVAADSIQHENLAKELKELATARDRVQAYLNSILARVSETLEQVEVLEARLGRMPMERAGGARHC